MPDEKPAFVIDHAILRCNGCGHERTFWPDKPLTSAADIKHWLETQVSRCPHCNSRTCDVRFHVKG